MSTELDLPTIYFGAIGYIDAAGQSTILIPSYPDLDCTIQAIIFGPGPCGFVVSSAIFMSPI